VPMPQSVAAATASAGHAAAATSALSSCSLSAQAHGFVEVSCCNAPWQWRSERCSNGWPAEPVCASRCVHGRATVMHTVMRTVKRGLVLTMVVMSNDDDSIAGFANASHQPLLSWLALFLDIGNFRWIQNLVLAAELCLCKCACTRRNPSATQQM
jgi:hypothetical protein